MSCRLTEAAARTVDDREGREQKAQSREIAEVRAGLAKLQTIRV